MPENAVSPARSNAPALMNASSPLSTALYELLVQAVMDYAIYMLDPSGHIVSWNPGAERIKGYAAKEIIGQHFSRFYTEEARAAGIPEAALKKARETGRFTAEAWRVRKDGSHFWAMVVIDPIFQNGELIGFAKITRDMTEQRNAQLQLEESREQLLQLQKMEAVGQLTGGLAHDFNNLLTGIAGNLDLASKGLSQGKFDDLGRYISAAQGATNRAAALTHRLLAFARRQPLDPKPTDPRVLISDIKDLLQRTLGASIAIETAIADDLWLTFVDPNQLENAIINLCINARDAMPQGGRLEIGANNVLLDESDPSSTQFVVISVTDTGAGMDETVLSRAFEPFFTTKPTGQGTGLGLSMVYGFAQQSGGRASISSGIGRGTSVRIFLPRYQGAAAEKVDAEVMPSQIDSGQTVLIVDDEPSVRMLMTEMLGELGFHTIEASDGAGGLKILQSNVAVDLLITDIGLPGGMNGRQLAEAARLKRRSLPVLLVTGYAEASITGTGALPQGMHLLTKPFVMDGLAHKLAEIGEEK